MKSVTRLLIFQIVCSMCFLLSPVHGGNDAETAESFCRELIEFVIEEQAAKEEGTTTEGKVAPRHSLQTASDLAALRANLEQRVLPDIRKEEWNQPRLVLQKQLSIVTDPDLRTALNRLLEKVLEEKQAQKDRLRERFKSFEERIAASLLGFGRAIELDQPIEEVNGLEADVSMVPYWDQGERPDTNRMRELLIQWQEYLYYDNRGEFQESKDRLRKLENLLGRYPLIPRSRILQLRERVAPETIENKVFQELSTIMARLDGPESYGAAVDALRGLFKRSNRNHKVSSYISVFESFIEAKKSIDAGNPETALSRLNSTRHAGGYGSDPVLGRERSRLILDALSVGMDVRLGPEEEESIATYVDRVASSLGEEMAWSDLWGFLDRVQKSQEFTSAPWVHNERNHCSKLIAGLRYEQVGDTETAYRMYSSVMNAMSRFNQEKGAQAGILRLIENDAGLPFRAKIQEEKLEALRRMVEQAFQQNPQGLPAHMLGEDALRKVVEATAREVVATELSKPDPVDPFTPSKTKSPPAAATGKRFELTYLDDEENKITDVFGQMTQDGIPMLRLLKHSRLDLGQVQAIEVLNPVPLEVMRQWPSRYEKGSRIPRTRLRIQLNTGSEIEDSMYSTLYLSFSDPENGQPVKLHPSRIISVYRVP